MEASELIAKHKNKIFNITVILLSLFIASKIYNKQMQDIDSLKAKKDLESKRSGILSSISKTDKKINAFKRILSRKDSSEIINTLSNLARESNVKILSIKPTQQQKYSDYIKIPFNLLISANDFHTLGHFISKIESYSDVYMVESIDVRSQNQPKQLSISLTLSSIVSK